MARGMRDVPRIMVMHVMAVNAATVARQREGWVAVWRWGGHGGDVKECCGRWAMHAVLADLNCDEDGVFEVTRGVEVEAPWSVLGKMMG